MTNEPEHFAALRKLGFTPTTDATLVAAAPDQPAKPVHEVTVQPQTIAEPVFGPTAVDPHLMPVDEIVFDERLLDKFPSLEGPELRAASDYVFSLYKSPGRDRLRNGALHRRITSFITQARRNRQTGGMVKETVKSTKEQRDIAAVIASQDATATEVADAFRAKQVIEALKAQGVDVMALMTE